MPYHWFQMSYQRGCLCTIVFNSSKLTFFFIFPPGSRLTSSGFDADVSPESKRVSLKFKWKSKLFESYRTYQHCKHLYFKKWSFNSHQTKYFNYKKLSGWDLKMQAYMINSKYLNGNLYASKCSVPFFSSDISTLVRLVRNLAKNQMTHSICLIFCIYDM